MKKIMSLVLSGILMSYSLTGCNSQTNLPVEELNTNQEVQSLANKSISEMDAAFNFIDDNRDKKISYQEFKSLIDILATTSKDKTLLYSRFETAFKGADANSDKMLDKTEFSSFGKETQLLAKNSFSSNRAVDAKYIRKAFDRIRGAEDTISERNFVKYLIEPPAPLTNAQASKMFIELDKNKDMRLDYKEFEKLFTKNDLEKNGFISKTVELVKLIPLLLVAPIIIIMDKLGLFDNLK